MQLLSGHISPETAYLVDDYPYGFRLRCRIRYWLEYKPAHGFRFVSQTTNPKRDNATWNKPKASTYFKFGAAMFLTDNGHVHWTGLSEYSDGAEALAFQQTYGDAVPEAGRKDLNQWVAAKVAYDAARDTNAVNRADLPLSVGLEEAHKAWLDEALKDYPKTDEATKADEALDDFNHVSSKHHY